ncbi:MAG: dipeptidase PepE [Candidatus Melainabacteria bacterium HGW-Melainabacteria-1]|nr:MAG: dipeptidase PepE [Candidatus Melainabacteria bacterium HGW-Melainabacteria-1]
MSRQLLLISSSRIHGQAYMNYCREELASFWGETRNILFIPFALKDWDTYAANVARSLEPMGFTIQPIQAQADFKAAIESASGLFIGGGNTFLLTKTLYEYDLLTPIRERVSSGALRYMGSSAGSNVAGPSLKTTNDMPIVEPPSFETLNLVPFQMNPHYQDPLPDSTHMGETREDRIREFHDWNEAPVLGLREGGLVEIKGDQATLLGVAGARLFQRGLKPEEYSPGADMSFLLKQK